MFCKIKKSRYFVTCINDNNLKGIVRCNNFHESNILSAGKQARTGSLCHRFKEALHIGRQKDDSSVCRRKDAVEGSCW